MLKAAFPGLILLWITGTWNSQAQVRYSPLIQSSPDGQSFNVSVEKPAYYPGDTVRVTIGRVDSSATMTVTPILAMEGTTLEPAGHETYVAVIPQNVTPGSYPIRLGVRDDQGRVFVYQTDCSVEVEEHQDVETVSRYARIGPEPGGRDPQTAMTLDREHMRNLYVMFRRDSIRLQMGPQFVRIRTSVESREGTTVQTFERRVLTFRSHGDPNRDHTMFVQYRAAYGAYAIIRPEELEQVRVQVDSMPDWAIIEVRIEPDYSIRVGGYDPTNSFTRYFRVKGPTIETGFTLGVPKVLYDTRAKDTVTYGNTSAMVRFYYVDEVSGNRFPVSLGIGTFGVSSPIDVDVGRGGFAASVFLDVVEIMRALKIDLGKKITGGLDLTPFFPIEKKSRLLVDAHVSLSL
jgi:hypothetical protein